MRKSMTYPIRFWALLLACLLLYQFSSDAFAESCKFEKAIDMTLDLSASDRLVIDAAAGELDIVGKAGSNQAVVSGRACASSESRLAETYVTSEKGKVAQISVSLPESSGGWSFTGNKYAWIDLKIEVPDNLQLEVNDSSGDMTLKGVASATIRDSSGEIEVEGAKGGISIADSSGDIDVDGVEGDLTIESDSSGDIELTNINGSVLVMKDSSGDIKATDVSNDVIIERDSSGDISAFDVGGDFVVLKDGSGDIRSNNIDGKVQVPEKD